MRYINFLICYLGYVVKTVISYSEFSLLKERSFTLINRIRMKADSSSYNGVSSVSSSNKVFGRWEEQHGNYILHPKNPDQKTEALIHFLGGALVGAAPDLTYRYILERLSDEGYLIVATPYDLSFNYLQTCDKILEKFERIAPNLARKYGPIPVIGVGHSCGALLQLLISSLFPDTPRAANILLSYNNKPISEAVPLFEEVVSPLFTTIAGGTSNSTEDESYNGVRGLELLLEGAKITLEGELPSDDFLFQLNRVLFPFSPIPLNSIIVPSLVRSTLHKAFFSPTSTKLRETGLLPILQQTLLILDQIPSLISEVADGVLDFTPSSASIEMAAKRAYRARLTLLIQYDTDSFDETPKVESMLLEAEKIMRVKRPSKPNMVLERKTLAGIHATPCIPFGVETASKAENILGESSAKEKLLYKNVDETVDVLVKWLQEKLM